MWRSIKQSCIADSTMEAEYVAACEASKEAVRLRKFLKYLEVVPNVDEPMTLYVIIVGLSLTQRNFEAISTLSKLRGNTI